MRPSAPSGVQTDAQTTMQSLSRFCGYVLVATCLSTAGVSRAQSIIGIGAPGQPSRGWDVSDDGNSVVGGVFLPRPPLSGTSEQPFEWRRGLGLQYYFPSLSFNTSMRATAVSGDGGTLIINVSATQRVVMRDPLNIIDVGGTPAALSQDGQTIVGSFVDAFGKTQAFRWTDSGGFLALGLAGGYSEAAAKVITRDGSVVFGLAGPAGAFRSDVPFRWSEDEGARVLPIPVGTFAPFAVSDGGEVLAGTDGFHAVRWSESSGALVLPSAGGFIGGAAVDISGNGELLVGSVGNIQPERAVLWDGDGRAWLLDDLLPQLGVETSGWRLTDAHAISQDGRFIAGTGIFAGTERAFLIDFGESGFSAPIPEPSAYGGAGVLALIFMKILRRRNPSGGGPSPGS